LHPVCLCDVHASTSPRKPSASLANTKKSSFVVFFDRLTSLPGDHLKSVIVIDNIFRELISFVSKLQQGVNLSLRQAFAAL